MKEIDRKEILDFTSFFTIATSIQNLYQKLVFEKKSVSKKSFEKLRFLLAYERESYQKIPFGLLEKSMETLRKNNPLCNHPFATSAFTFPRYGLETRVFSLLQNRFYQEHFYNEFHNERYDCTIGSNYLISTFYVQELFLALEKGVFSEEEKYSLLFHFPQIENFFWGSSPLQDVFSPTLLKFCRVEDFALRQDLDYKVMEDFFFLINNSTTCSSLVSFFSFFFLSLVQDASFKEYLLSDLKKIMEREEKERKR